MPRRHSDELVYQEGDNFVDVEIPVLRMEAELICRDTGTRCDEVSDKKEGSSEGQYR